MNESEFLNLVRERYINECSLRLKYLDFLKCILRDSIRHPRLAVKKAHATPVPTLPSYKTWLVMKSDNHSRFP